LLALLGFSCEIFEQRMEYGTPHATYKAKGVVVSESGGSPIEGIRTELKENEGYYGTIATADTDSKGSFSLSGSTFPGQKLYVVLTDVDGEANGSFVRMQIEADYTNATYTGGDGHWYSGTKEINLGTIKMQPEKPEESEEPENPENPE
jgi:putative lipoprotein (rSAM/lipoprotein system)